MQFGIISPLVLMATAHAVACVFILVSELSRVSQHLFRALPSYQTGYDKVTRDVASGSNTFGGYNMPDTSQPCWHSSTHDVNAVSFVDSDTRDEYVTLVLQNQPPIDNDAFFQVFQTSFSNRHTHSPPSFRSNHVEAISKGSREAKIHQESTTPFKPHYQADRRYP